MAGFFEDLNQYMMDLMEPYYSGQAAVDYPFPENQIVLGPQTRPVRWWFPQIYISLHPTKHAFMVHPTGEVRLLQGGYNVKLRPGNWQLYYVDKKDRVKVLQGLTETTRDGAQIALNVIVSYRVSDPLHALDMPQPVDTLFSLLQSDLKEFIRTHQHDEIIGTSSGQRIDSSEMAKFVREQHAGRKQMYRLFRLLEVVMEERVGDPNFTEIRKDFQVRQRQKDSETNLLEQKQNLERRVAEQEAQIKRIKAEAEVEQEKIRRAMREQEIQLETERMNMKLPWQKWERTLGVLDRALANPSMLAGQPQVLRDLVAELRNSAKLEAMPGPGDGQPQPEAQAAQKKSAERIDTLTEALLNMIDRK